MVGHLVVCLFFFHIPETLQAHVKGKKRRDSAAMFVAIAGWGNAHDLRQKRSPPF